MAGGIFFLLNQPGETGVTIVVSSPTAVSAPQGDESPPPAPTQPGLIDIDTAAAGVLMTLPGIGEVKAQAIIDYREREGRFRRTDELLKVPGIGSVTYERLSELVTVGAGP